MSIQIVTGYFLLKTDIRILRSVHLCTYDGIPMPRWDALREAWNPEVLNPSWPAVFRRSPDPGIDRMELIFKGLTCVEFDPVLFMPIYLRRRSSSCITSVRSMPAARKATRR
jgi:hypothetical protein